MFDMVLTMPRVLNMPGFWIYQGSHYASGYEYVRVTQSFEYVWIIPEYAWIIPGYALISLNMPEYTETCVKIPKCAWMAFVLHFPIIIPWRLECVVTYFNVYKKLEVIVWRNMSLFSWRAGYTWFAFCFRLIIFTSKISNLLLPLTVEGVEGRIREYWFNLWKLSLTKIL